MPKITKATKLNEIVQKYPKAVDVILKHNLHCIGCPMAAQETLEQGAKAHGLSDKEIEKLVKEINKKLEEKNA